VSGAGGADLAVEVFGFPAGEHNGLGLREVAFIGRRVLGRLMVAFRSMAGDPVSNSIVAGKTEGLRGLSA
jgi:hypothetical protein